METPADPPEAGAIESFAIVCELLNDYARTLRSTAAFPEVRTGADIRHFSHGWRLEKWVEAELNREEGHWACWWIELGATGGHWLIDTHLSISHHPLFISLQEAQAVPADQLRPQLLRATEELTRALETNATFAREIAQLKQP